MTQTLRILHLIDAASPQAHPTTLALLADQFGRLGHAQQGAVLFGGRRLALAARAAGLDGFDLVGVPFGQAVAGCIQARHALRAMGGFEIVHCWSVGTLALAVLLLRQTPKVLTVTTPPSDAALRWMRVLCEQAGQRVAVLATSSTLRRTLLSRGLGQAGVAVLRPGIDMSRVAGQVRAGLREHWRAQDPGAKVVALLTDPPGAGDAVPSALAVSLAAETLADGRDYRLLIHPDAPHRRRIQNALHAAGRGHRVIQDSRLDTPWSVLPGCDAALAQGPNAGQLSLLWAMSAGVPIVGEATYAVSEVVEDRHSALLCKPDSPKAVAHRLRQLFDDPQLAYKLRDTARHEAYSFFSRQRYCTNVRGVYDQLVAGEPLAVPEMESTGGLRFTGRG